jgi:hypothetical protein
MLVRGAAHCAGDASHTCGWPCGHLRSHHIQTMRITFIFALAGVIIAMPGLPQHAPGSAGNGGRSAQSKPVTGPMAGSASMQTHLQALHYKNIQELRRGPDGQWVGNATQGNVPKMVTIAPDGTITAR